MLARILGFFSSSNDAEQLDAREPIRDQNDDNNEKADEESYKWDYNLKHSNDNFREKISISNYNEDAAKRIPFASDYLLAKFSELAYQSKGYWLPENWELLTTAYNDGPTNGYFGVAFWNSKLCQVVVAHRGTDFKVRGARRSDRQLALNKEKTEQSQSAVTFVYKITEEIKRKMKTNNVHIQLSITGHSLGAWLAQITTFTAKYFKRDGISFVEDGEYLENIHAHTVVFDSPGCEIALAKLRRKFVHNYDNQKQINYNSLDMTVYLNEPNFINSVNGHVGTIYLTQSASHTITDVLDLFDANYKIDKKIVLEFPKGKLASLMLLAVRFGFYFRANKLIPTKPYIEDEYSLNVFSEKELSFIYNWYFAAEIPSSNIKQLKSKYSIPTFVINYYENKFISESLAETIASIKNLRPTGDLIFKSLQESEQDVMLYEQLKWKTEEYHKSLRSWNNYYFKDVHNLKQFLKSNNRVLHIYVDSEDHIKLEINILLNVFKYYQRNGFTQSDNYFTSGRYGFLIYGSRLYNMIQSNIFHKHEVNLLIIECCSKDPKDIDAISQLIQNDNTIKIVAVSVGSWNGYDFVGKSEMEEVGGYGNNIKLQHLLECSREKLMTENKLIWYGEAERSLNEVVEEESFLCNEVLLGVLLRPPEDGILIPFQDNTFINAVRLLDLHCEIKPTEIIKHDDELQYIIEDSENCGLLSSCRSVFNRACKPTIIQDKVDLLKCNNLQKISYLFKIYNQKLFLTKIYNSRFYMPRYVCHTKLVQDSIFNYNDDEDLYYFCGNKEEFKQKLAESLLSDERKERFQFISKANNRLKYMQENVHLFKIENHEIIWLYSNHQINALRKHISLAENFIPEHELMSNDSIVILSGGAGMGKSSTIGYLYEYHKQQNDWVFALPLGQAVFDEIIEEISFDSAAKFILKSCDISTSDFVKCLLSYCLKNKTKVPVYLLFDAFDEVYKERDRKKFLNLIDFLKRNSTAKMLITTRKFTTEELENKLSLFASSFKTADYGTEIKGFFTEFWYTQQRLFETVTNSKQLEEFSENLFHYIDGNLGNTIFNLKAIPLYTRMLAEIITPMLNHEDSTHFEQIAVNNILELYDRYIQIHYNIYFKRTQPNENIVQQYWLLESISKRLHKLAIEKLTNVSLTSIKLQELEELNKVGLIQAKVHNDPIGVNITNTSLFNVGLTELEELHVSLEFVHESLRDYFVAKVLKMWLESHAGPCPNNWNIQKFIVSDLWTKSEYKEIRFFLNAQIRNHTVSDNRLLQCQNKLQLLGKTALITHNDDSAFHICVREKLCFLSKYFLFKIIDTVDKVKLLSARNCNLETPLYLAIVATDGQNTSQVDEDMLRIFLEKIYQWPKYDDSKRVLLATICTYFVRDEHIQQLERFSENYTDIQELLEDVFNRYQQTGQYLRACQINSYENLNQILEEFKDDEIAKQYLLLRTNEFKETGLHLTKSDEILKLLLKNGAYKNLRDNHGMTPLNRAIKRKLTKIAITLIKEKVNLNVGDNLGYVPLICAAKYNNLDVVRSLMLPVNVSNIDINQTTVYQVTALMIATNHGNYNIVECLLKNGADVNAKDRNGMNIIHHAVKGDHKKLIRIFKSYGTDINLQDRNGVTPLLYSIQKEKWNMVNSLLDNGANTEIGNHDNIFPVQLLRQKGKTRIINKINKINLERKEKHEAMTNNEEGISDYSSEDSE